MMILQDLNRLNLSTFLSNQRISNTLAFKRFDKFVNILCIFLKILIFLFLFKTINSKSSNNINSNKKEKERDKDSELLYSNKNKYPVDLKIPFKSLFQKKNSVKCFEEIVEIYKKDFTLSNNNNVINNIDNGNKSKKQNTFNPYFNIILSEKSFGKIFKNFNKKLNKLEFHEQKNFTGIRWINYNETYHYEIRKKSLTYLDNIYEYFEKTYSKCNKNLPEIIIESYLFFNNKIKELKKIFSKFYLFKGIKKFMKCYEKYEFEFTKEFFLENLRTGNFSSKNFIEKLNKIYLSIRDLINSLNVKEFAFYLHLVILELRGIPGF
jgi:hypothetical protein